MSACTTPTSSSRPTSFSRLTPHLPTLNDSAEPGGEEEGEEESSAVAGGTADKPASGRKKKRSGA
jgi:hypothetical protein